MDLAQKSQAVLDLFQELGDEAKQFASESGLGCITGCGACCSNPQVPASPLEFLPLAFDFYYKGLAESVLDMLDSDDMSGNCIVYRAYSNDGKKGFCTNYASRGLICRLFAASARKNKHGQKELITCKLIKEQKSTAYQLVAQRINDDLGIPMASAYYTRLKDIDESLCQEFSINRAISFALELVLRYKFYQEEDQQLNS